MHKGTRKEIFFMFLLLLFSSAAFVLAAGSSGGGSTAPSKTPPSSAQEIEAPVDCESKGFVADRIKCRLVEDKYTYGVHESCRGLANEADCGQLYKNVAPCYDLVSKAKDQCFLKYANIETKRITNDTDKSSVRNYLLFLLYDLEEQVEEAYEEKNISADAATDIIVKIIAVKQEILKGSNKVEIKTSLQVLKDTWKEEMSDA